MPLTTSINSRTAAADLSKAAFDKSVTGVRELIDVVKTMKVLG